VVWKKWKAASGVLCDERVPLVLKGKVYRMVVRSAVLYRSECWPLKKTQIQRLTVAEMKMVRWMCGFIRMNRVRNCVIRDLAKVAPIEEKMRESRLRWLGYVKRRSMAVPVRRCELIDLPGGKRGRGRPKENLDKVIREDLKVVGLSEDLTHDRKLWRNRIRILDGREASLLLSVAAVA